MIPYQTPWHDSRTSRLAKARSRRARAPYKSIIPRIEWGNNAPKAFKARRKSPKFKKKRFSRATFRYFRKLPPSLILRDGLGDLIRPSVIMKRPRNTYTYWNRPRILRCTQIIFCVIKGVGAGEKPRRRFRPRT